MKGLSGARSERQPHYSRNSISRRRRKEIPIVTRLRRCGACKARRKRSGIFAGDAVIVPALAGQMSHLRADQLIDARSPIDRLPSFADTFISCCRCSAMYPLALSCLLKSQLYRIVGTRRKQTPGRRTRTSIRDRERKIMNWRRNVRF